MAYSSNGPFCDEMDAYMYSMVHHNTLQTDFHDFNINTRLETRGYTTTENLNTNNRRYWMDSVGPAWYSQCSNYNYFPEQRSYITTQLSSEECNLYRNAYNNRDRRFRSADEQPPIEEPAPFRYYVQRAANHTQVYRSYQYHNQAVANRPSPIIPLVTLAPSCDLVVPPETPVQDKQLDKSGNISNNAVESISSAIITANDRASPVVDSIQECSESTRNTQLYLDDSSSDFLNDLPNECLFVIDTVRDTSFIDNIHVELPNVPSLPSLVVNTEATRETVPSVSKDEQTKDNIKSAPLPKPPNPQKDKVPLEPTECIQNTVDVSSPKIISQPKVDVICLDSDSDDCSVVELARTPPPLVELSSSESDDEIEVCSPKTNKADDILDINNSEEDESLLSSLPSAISEQIDVTNCSPLPTAPIVENSVVSPDEIVATPADNQQTSENPKELTVCDSNPISSPNSKCFDDNASINSIDTELYFSLNREDLPCEQTSPDKVVTPKKNIKKKLANEYSIPDIYETESSCCSDSVEKTATEVRDKVPNPLSKETNQQRYGVLDLDQFADMITLQRPAETNYEPVSPRASRLLNVAPDRTSVVFRGSTEHNVIATNNSLLKSKSFFFDTCSSSAESEFIPETDASENIVCNTSVDDISIQPVDRDPNETHPIVSANIGCAGKDGSNSVDAANGAEPCDNLLPRISGEPEICTTNPDEDTSEQKLIKYPVQMYADDCICISDSSVDSVIDVVNTDSSSCNLLQDTNIELNVRIDGEDFPQGSQSNLDESCNVRKRRHDGTFKFGERISGVHSMIEEGTKATRNHFYDYWTPDRSLFYDHSWGGEDFDHNNARKLMPRNAVSWSIPEDHGRRPKGFMDRVRCQNCRQMGHKRRDCPIPIKACSMCGLRTHNSFKCPQACCLNCFAGVPGSFQTRCDRCARWANGICRICRYYGHVADSCPDLWRRYHLTVNPGSVVKPTSPGSLPQQKLWCSGCGQRGHLSENCHYFSHVAEYPINSMLVCSYSDVYSVITPPAKKRKISGNDNWAIHNISYDSMNNSYIKNNLDGTQEIMVDPESYNFPQNEDLVENPLFQQDQVTSNTFVESSNAVNILPQMCSTPKISENVNNTDLVQDTTISNSKKPKVSIQMNLSKQKYQVLKSPAGQECIAETSERHQVVISVDAVDQTKVLVITGSKASGFEARAKLLLFLLINVPRHEFQPRLTYKGVKNNFLNLTNAIGDPITLHANIVCLENNLKRRLSCKVLNKSRKRVALMKQIINLRIQLNNILIGSGGVVPELDTYVNVLQKYFATQQMPVPTLPKAVKKAAQMIFINDNLGDYDVLIKKYYDVKQLVPVSRKRGRKKQRK